MLKDTDIFETNLKMCLQMMMGECEPWIHGHPLYKTLFQQTYVRCKKCKIFFLNLKKLTIPKDFKG